MKTFAVMLILAASACLAARIETLTLDLERPQQPFSISVTEATDSTVSARLLAAGSEFDPAGWTGLLWYGSAAGGITITNGASGYGLMSWSIPLDATPTNGRYSVQLLGAISNRVEEWGRGALTVRVNPSRDYLPVQWTTNSAAYALAVQVQSALAAHAIASNPHAITPELIGAATPAHISAAINALPPPSTDAIRLVTPDGTQWLDATGGVWRVVYVAATNISCTLSNPFGKLIGPDSYDRPYESVYIAAANSQLEPDPYPWLINFDSANEGLWNVFNYEQGIWWAASGNELPLVAESGTGNIGTATFDYAITYTPVTARVDTVALLSDIAGLSSAWTNSLLYASGGTNYYPRWDSALQTYVVTGVPQ